MNTAHKRVLVTGATGTQGGATARALLQAGIPVRLLVRDPAAPGARALAQAGAELCQGNFEDAGSLREAVSGVYGVFSVQRPDSDGSDSECRHGLALIEAARAALVQHFVHTSVCESGRHTDFPRWESGYWGKSYWQDKWTVEEAVRGAGFPLWTVLKPAFLMDNFIPPKVSYMFPHLREGRIITALYPQTRLQLIAASDVGDFAQAAICEPERFGGLNIDLGAESLTMDEIAGIISSELGTTVTATSVDPAAAKTAGLFAGWVRTQEWINEVGYRADEAEVRTWGVPLTPFADWVRGHSSEFVIDN